MSLKIIKGEDLAIDGIIVMLYGEPSAGKTSLSLTASSPVLFDFDDGAKRSAFKVGKDIVKIGSWNDIVSSAKTFDSLLAKYDTIVIDTVETCLDYIRIYIEDKDYKLKTNTLRMYGRLKDEFNSFISRITKLGKDVILTAHSTTEEQNGVVRTVPKITGGSKDIVKQKADFMGYMFIRNNVRVIDFNPTDYYDGKNSAEFDIITIPDFNLEPNFMAELIERMKASMIKIDKEQTKATSIVEEFLSLSRKVKTADEYNELIESMKALDVAKGVKSQIWANMRKEAEKKGLIYDAKEKSFYEPKKEEKTEEIEDEPKKGKKKRKTVFDMSEEELAKLGEGGDIDDAEEEGIFQ